jgi:starch-binding outer membrane protein, SusD/RagB family
MSFLKKSVFLATIIAGIGCMTACKKFLDEKSDQHFQLLRTVTDLQALLDDYFLINQRNPSAGEVSTDDYYIADADFDKLTDFDRRKYTWVNDHQFKPGVENDWSFAYENVNKANLVLDNIDKVERNPGDETAWRIVKGHALFLRGQAFLQVAAIWAQAYDEATAATEPGIPLRLDADFNKPSVRASLKETYDRIISDLTDAASLLPVQPVHVLRPSKPAAYGLLARTYLFMRKYELSGEFANKALDIKTSLKDYNTLNTAQNPIFPFAPRFSNEEIICESQMAGSPALFFTVAKIDLGLYNSYTDNDLRKLVFFRDNSDGTYSFRGNYTGSSTLYDGVATDELYLIRAESHARQGMVSEAMNDLNTLLVTRWKIDPNTNMTTYVDQTAADADEALYIILTERRKELLMRGLRWMDLKRLNKEGADIKLQRTVKGTTYQLLPNAAAYALAIPEDVPGL